MTHFIRYALPQGDSLQALCNVFNMVASVSGVSENGDALARRHAIEKRQHDIT